MGRNYNQLQLTGKRFGRLVVVGEAGRNKRKDVLWRCKCDCGNETTAVANSLLRGLTQSCGCYHSEVVAETNRSRRLPEGMAAFNQLYKRYKFIAKKRNLPFELTKEDFSFITKMNCRYCGREPSQNSKTTTGSSYIYNGVDRIDSSKGYNMKNVVPCCKTCNGMKKNMDVSDFLKHIKKIYNRSKRWL